MHVAPRILSNFVTLFVAIGLVETAVAFANLTAGLHRSLAVRSVTIAGLSVLPIFVDRYPGIAVDIIGLERGFRADALRLDLDCVRSHAGQHTQPDRVGSASDARGGGSGDLDLRAIRAVHLCPPLSRRGDAALMYSTY